MSQNANGYLDQYSDFLTRRDSRRPPYSSITRYQYQPITPASSVIATRLNPFQPTLPSILHLDRSNRFTALPYVYLICEIVHCEMKFVYHLSPTEANLEGEF